MVMLRYKEDVIEVPAVELDEPAAASIATDSDEARRARRIQAVETELADAELNYRRLKDLTKTAKKMVDEVAEVLQSLRNGHVETSEPPKTETQPTPPEADGDLWGDLVSEQPPQPVAPASWRGVHLKEIGFTPKKLEALEAAGVHTVGDFDDRRIEGTIRDIPGIGKATAEKMENAVLLWLSVNRDKENLAMAAKATTSNDESDPEVGDVVARAEQLDDGSEDCLGPKLEVHGSWESGKDYYARDLAITDCPYVMGPQQDDWIRGYVAAKKADEYEMPEEIEEEE